MPSDAVERFLEKSKGVRRSGEGWVARCPCREDDQNPTLTIAEGRDGKVLVNCHRGGGCNTEEICAAMGLTINDLFEKPLTEARRKEQKLEQVARYDYKDADGKLAFQKLKYLDEEGRKTFRIRRPNPETEQWEWGKGDCPDYLYNLPAVLKAAREGGMVYVVEGEKDADTLIRQGLVATTTPMGAGEGKWQDIHTEALSGAQVTVISDLDQAGVQHSANIIDSLHSNGTLVYGLRPPEVYEGKKVKDITDLVEAGGGVDDLREFDGKWWDDPFKDFSIEVKQLARSEMPPSEKMERARLLLDRISEGDDLVLPEVLDWHTLFDEVDEAPDWVIPDTLEKGERVMVVAPEGRGKSMLARQVAICTAAGINPFTWLRMPKKKTLTIDLENPRKIIRRTTQGMYKTALMRMKEAGETHATYDDIWAKIVPIEDGLDVLKARDRIIFEDIVAEAQPDLLCIGPVYKLFIDPGGRTSEAIVTEVAKFLDHIRKEYGCALWIEHHAPLGEAGSRQLRPFGSAVWSRWPEFGLWLDFDHGSAEKYHYLMGHYRGARDVRTWPVKLRRSTVFPFEAYEMSDE